MTAECGTHNLLAASVWHGEWKIKVRAKTLSQLQREKDWKDTGKHKVDDRTAEKYRETEGHTPKGTSYKWLTALTLLL